MLTIIKPTRGRFLKYAADARTSSPTHSVFKSYLLSKKLLPVNDRPTQ